MLEEMSSFFEKRLDGYDEHMMTNIEGAREFYPFTASCLPSIPDANVLDLGCGTGLELEEYFRINPTAKITGIDLSEKMLEALKRKFTDRSLTLISGSYFSLPFEDESFNAAVSVESLHHFSAEEKLPLYKKIHRSLTDRGYFILTDYFAPSEEDEIRMRDELIRLKRAEGLDDNQFYHYDTPMTVPHEIEVLVKAGFSNVQILKSWGATYTIKAVK